MHDVYASPEFEQNYTYTGTDLGSTWNPEGVFFRLWAPTAREVTVRIYESGTLAEEEPLVQLPMTPDIRGTWVARLDGDWNGRYYTFLAQFSDHRCEACDPYARAVGVNGSRAMILDLAATEPDGWETDRGPHRGMPLTDAVIYEAHIRDLSMDPASGITQKGTYLGFCETGTSLPSGIPTGLVHIRNLGVTHVQLQPVFDFGSVDEADSDRSGYNWGYDPVNFNVPEGSYSSDPFHGQVRVREFREMVKKIHDSGLSIIMDVVYNHVYKAEQFCFNKLVPGYFSRPDSDGSCCGNDTASERPMVRKFIVDSILMWVRDFHIDGFRFDLAGLIDCDTIRAVQKEVGRYFPGIVFYGEGWSMDTKLTKPGLHLASQESAGDLPDFAFFNDSFRDLLRGSVFDSQEQGFLAGWMPKKEPLITSFMGVTSWACSPSQSVNYISCHDNHTLWDRLKLALPSAPDNEIARRCRLGGAFTMLSQGVPFLLAGEEMLRSKPIRPGHYESNSYRSGDELNSIKWSDLNKSEVLRTRNFYTGLIALRRSRECFRMHEREEVMARIRPLNFENSDILAFRIRSPRERVLVLFHLGKDVCSFPLPEGCWQCLVDGERAGTAALSEHQDAIELAPLSACVLVQEKEKPLVPVVAALVTRKDKILLCQRPEHKARGGLWELPGGKVEPGETPAQALIRECREELGMSVEPVATAAIVEHAYSDIRIQLTVLRCRADGQVPVLMEHKALRWVEDSAVLHYDLCPADRIVFEILSSGKAEVPGQ